MARVYEPLLTHVIPLPNKAKANTAAAPVRNSGHGEKLACCPARLATILMKVGSEQFDLRSGIATACGRETTCSKQAGSK